MYLGITAELASVGKRVEIEWYVAGIQSQVTDRVSEASRQREAETQAAVIYADAEAKGISIVRAQIYDHIYT